MSMARAPVFFGTGGVDGSANTGVFVPATEVSAATSPPCRIFRRDTRGSQPGTKIFFFIAESLEGDRSRESYAFLKPGTIMLQSDRLRLRKNSKSRHSERSEESLFDLSTREQTKRDSSLRSEWQTKSFFPLPVKPVLFRA